MNKAILSLGSNLGDKIFYLNKAIKYLKNTTRINFLRKSSFYKTKPFKTPNSQDYYINCCVEILTDLNPFTLLGICLGIESSLGRKRPYKFSPRTIDIDLIYYENQVINTNDLILPHPRMHERAFVLEPLKELYPNGIVFGFNFEKFLILCDNSEIFKI